MKSFLKKSLKKNEEKDALHFKYSGWSVVIEVCNFKIFTFRIQISNVQEVLQNETAKLCNTAHNM